MKSYRALLEFGSALSKMQGALLYLQFPRQRRAQARYPLCICRHHQSALGAALARLAELLAKLSESVHCDNHAEPAVLNSLPVSSKLTAQAWHESLAADQDLLSQLSKTSQRMTAAQKRMVLL